MNPAPFLMFGVLCVVLMAGFPVAFSLGGTALLFAWVGIMTGTFDDAFINTLPNRIYGLMSNQELVAVPLFILMGVTLEKSRVADALLETMAELFGRLRGGLGLSVTLVGMLMAASTGIVGATVVTMGLLSLPTMLRRGYHPAFASGTICATGTLGQIIPPSIALVLLGDVLSNAYQKALTTSGQQGTDTVSVGHLFAGALLPGLLLVVLYGLYILGVAFFRPSWAPAPSTDERSTSQSSLAGRVLWAMAPPLVLILTVLGSILAGVATPTEGAALGAVGALVLAVGFGYLSRDVLQDILRSSVKVTSMVFAILVGAAMFSAVFRGFEGDEAIRDLFERSSLGQTGLLIATMVVIFLLGFVLDFIEITFVVVPIVGPILLSYEGIDPVWLGVMLAVNLQTSFLTPPFGFSLFYLRGVAPREVSTWDIYRGVVPYIGIQLLVLGILFKWPLLATWLPDAVYAK